MDKKIISIILIVSLLLGVTGREISTAASTENDSEHTKAVKEEPNQTTYIPEDLLELIEQKMKQGDERASFSAMLSDKELNAKELKSYQSNKSLKEYMNMLNESSGLALKVDADNDGIEDLFFVINDGGSMGNTSRYLLKGKADGTYSMTYKTYDITQELAFISYNKTNYLLETTFNYDSKEYDGFQLSCFKDGNITERVCIYKGAKEYTVNTTVKDIKFIKLANTCKTTGLKNYAYDLRYEKNDVVIGTAEKKLSKKQYKKYAEAFYSEYPFYSCDYDNDKTVEIYAKDIFYSSTIHTLTCLEDYLFEPGHYKTYSEMCDKYFPKISGTPQMFWVEKTAQGNVICILCLDNLLDYTIYGYKITKGKAKEVFRDTFIAKSIINHNIYTRGINLKDETM